MGEKIKNVLTHNMGLKIVSLISAALFWLIVVNIEDPSLTRTFTTTVEVQNQDILKKQGKYFVYPDGNNTVVFRVSARRSIIEKLSGADFTATADMNNLENDSRLPVDITPNRYRNVLTIESTDHYLMVEIGKERTSNFVITAKTKGTPAEGYVADKISLKPNVITVSGPEQNVAKIKTVRAIADLDKLNTDVVEKAVPVLLDKNGKEIDTTTLSLSVQTVDVYVTMAMVKKVPIRVETSGEPPEGVKVVDITTDPKRISIQGPSDVLNDMTEVVIPSSVIALDNIVENMEAEVDISEYLPEGVRLSSDSEAKVKISVEISRWTVKKFEIPTKNLTINNAGDAEVKFKKEKMVARIEGYEDELNELNVNDITGSIDVDGLNKGEHTVSVQLDLDEQFSAQKASTDVDIKR